MPIGRTFPRNGIRPPAVSFSAVVGPTTSFVRNASGDFVRNASGDRIVGSF